jgi:hypothetical protein
MVSLNIRLTSALRSYDNESCNLFPSNLIFIITFGVSRLVVCLLASCPLSNGCRGRGGSGCGNPSLRRRVQWVALGATATVEVTAAAITNPGAETTDSGARMAEVREAQPQLRRWLLRWQGHLLHRRSPG